MAVQFAGIEGCQVSEASQRHLDVAEKLGAEPVGGQDARFWHAGRAEKGQARCCDVFAPATRLPNTAILIRKERAAPSCNSNGGKRSPISSFEEKTVRGTLVGSRRWPTW